MLTTTNNARYKFLRKVLVLPIAFAAVVALSVSATETKATPVESPVVKNDTVPVKTVIVEKVPTEQPKKVIVRPKHVNKTDSVKTVTVEKVHVEEVKDVKEVKEVKVEEVPHTPVQIRLEKKEKLTMPATALYVINGQQSTVEVAKKLKADQIESINVLKGKSATDKYGTAGENGAIEIVLKGILLK